MELKTYQKKVIADLTRYLELLNEKAQKSRKKSLKRHRKTFHRL